MNTQNADFKFKIFIRTIKKVEHGGEGFDSSSQI